MSDLENSDFIDFEAELEKAKRQAINKAIADRKVREAMEEQGLSSPEELKETLPKANAAKLGKIELVRMDGIALTETGKLTQAKYFDRMSIRNELYGDLTFTKEEAQGIMTRLVHLSTGVNSVTALRCMGPSCYFASDCPYQQIDKAMVGRPCLIEADLLVYHSQKFMKQFEVDPDDHTEVLLVQELSELVIYEMRVARVLATPENALLFQEEIKIDKEGNEIKNEQIHWGWELKDKIKNRRMKILEALNATRKARHTQTDAGPGTFADFAKALTDKMDKIKDAQDANIIYTDNQDTDEHTN